ncbi:hypothetical protein [Sorangium cellulosum]|uniref:hypothetical protein n=1 Tax=Sorangium cellulosum TaxID=56 RepID=UPI0002F7D285|nr:hypothetical protein [Sorangium cellulosum]
MLTQGAVRPLYSGGYAEAEAALSLPVCVGQVQEREVLTRPARAVAQAGEPG